MSEVGERVLVVDDVLEGEMPKRPGLAGLSAVGLAAAWALRGLDRRDARWAWDALATETVRPPALFGPAMVAGLPEPARRYFTFAIAPGTPLRMVVEIDMVGEIGLGDRDRPNYQPMVAREILAPPHGFVWMPRIGSGLGRISGSDACIGERAWTRFWLLNTVPVARTKATPDLIGSGQGRCRGVLGSRLAPAGQRRHLGARRRQPRGPSFATRARASPWS